MMRATRFILAATLVAMGAAGVGWAESLQANPDDVNKLFKAVEGDKTAMSPPLTRREAGGFIEFFGVSPDRGVPVDGTKARADTAARSFLEEYGAAFGILSPKVSFVRDSVRIDGGETVVRMGQTYNGLEVFGAQALLLFSYQGKVRTANVDVMRRTSVLDEGDIPLSPSVSADDVFETVKNRIKAKTGVDDLVLVDEPELVVYDPAVLSKPGSPSLAWSLTVADASGSGRVYDRVLTDAHTARELLSYTLKQEAKIRQVYDANNEIFVLGELAREEGDPPTDVPDVNDAYMFLGDTYDFYFDEHDRDGLDDQGSPLKASVRFCWFTGCPMANAFYIGPTGDGDTGTDIGFGLQSNHMYFGEGWASDDVTAHELTHGVTAFTSNLIYQGESGAINEAFSDIWGEYVDLSNTAGTDGPEVRWLMGEDTPIGAIRDMANPPAFTSILLQRGAFRALPMPDRYRGEGWYTGPSDNGGVHHNSGVGNKLCYLLTDGDTFNDFEVPPLGLSRTADLFYRTQTALLTESSDYPNFAIALVQAGVDLGFDAAEFQSLLNALRAVELFDEAFNFDEDALELGFRAVPIEGEDGVSLTWDAPQGVQLVSQSVFRSFDGFDALGTGDPIFTGTGTSHFDDDVSIGQEAFYLLRSLVSFGLEVIGSGGENATTIDIPLILEARYRTIAGEPTPDYLSMPLDAAALTTLPGMQVTFRPAYSQATADATGRPADYVNYLNYTASVQLGLKELPWPRVDAISVPLTDNGLQVFDLEELYNRIRTQDMPPFAPIPFFGKLVSFLEVRANGYLAPASDAVVEREDETSAPEEFSYFRYFRQARIAPLFADLDPSSGGEVWIRILDDRLVATWERVPEHGSRQLNTVQAEIWYNGQIRFTYLEVSTPRGVTGLSDGRGVPRDPGNTAEELTTFLPDLPPTPGFSIEPVPLQFAEEGDLIEFQVTTTAPEGGQPVTLTASGLPEGATFVSPVAGTATFQWQTTPASGGSYSFEVTAVAGTRTATQTVNLVVVDLTLLPAADNLTIAPAQPEVVDFLVASYDYSHPERVPEGDTGIFWFRNGGQVPALNDTLLVPPAATRAGERWFFRVTPVTNTGLVGETQQSPTVTITEASEDGDVNKDGDIDAIDVQQVINAVLGVPTAPGFVPDVNTDQQVNAVDVQIVINRALGVN